MKIPVLLVDNHELIRMGYRLVLSSTPDIAVIGEAATGAEAMRLITAGQPAVVLMDTAMPNLGGIDTLRRLRRLAPASAILVLTTFGLDTEALTALQAGASGFLPKDVRPDDLTTAIRTIAAGNAVVSPRVTRELLDRLQSSRERIWDTGQGTGNDPLGTLTPREREVFMNVVAGRSNAEIAERICTSEATVKTHVTRFLAKLDLRDRVHAVIYGYENGLGAGV